MVGFVPKIEAQSALPIFIFIFTPWINKFSCTCHKAREQSQWLDNYRLVI